MRLMSYNMLRGGTGPGGDRTARILDLLARQRADFVALQEANRFAPDEANRLAEFSARLGLAEPAQAGVPRAPLRGARDFNQLIRYRN